MCMPLLAEEILSFQTIENGHDMRVEADSRHSTIECYKKNISQLTSRVAGCFTTELAR